MATSLTARIKAAIRTELTGRGWRPQKGGSYLAPEGTVEAPLSLEWRVELDGANSGGVRLDGSAQLHCDEAMETILGFDRDGLPPYVTVFPGDEMARLVLVLDHVTPTSLLDPVEKRLHNWRIDDDADQIATAVAEYVAVIDGPLVDWVTRRRSVALLLDERPPGHSPRLDVGPRMFAVMYLQHDRPDRARAVLGKYEPTPRDPLENMVVFERDLAAAFPAYGEPQHTS